MISEFQRVKEVFKEAKQLIRTNRHDDARYLLYLILNYYPDNTYALVEYGKLYELDGNYEKAHECYEKVEAGDKLALFKNAKLFVLEGKYQEAHKRFDKLREAGDMDAAYEKGRLYAMEGNYKEAHKCYEEIEAWDKLALFQNAKLYALEGNYQEAHSRFDRLIETGDRYALFEKGRLYTMEGKYQEAHKCFDRLIETEDRYALFEKGRLYVLEGNYEKAHECCERLINIGDNYALFQNGTLYILESKYKEAYDCFARLREKGTNPNMVLSNRILLLYTAIKCNIVTEELIKEADTYTERQIISYSKDEALKLISNHTRAANGKERYSTFSSNIDINYLIDNIVLAEDTIVSRGPITKNHLIKFNSIGFDENGEPTDYLFVTTFVDNDNILKMRPANPNSIVIDEGFTTIEDNGRTRVLK